MSLSAIPKALRGAVAERDAGRCRYCGLRQVGQAAVFHIDHVIPRSRGGLTTLDNLVLQCPSCSLRKSDKVSGTEPSTRSEVALFHPLKQIWTEHFELQRDGMCRGLTTVGRVTIEALRMNDPLPRAARAMQVMLGLIECSTRDPSER